MRAFMLVPLFAASTTAANADPVVQPLLQPAQPRSSVEPTETVVTGSYRRDTLIADGASVGLVLASLALPEKSTASDIVVGTGLIGTLVAAPLVHVLHGEPGHAAGSLLLRTLSVSVGALVGAEVASQSCSPHEFLCGLDGAVPGAIGGYVLASAVDAALLTNKTETRPVGVSRWTPMVTPRSGGASVGVATTW